MKKLIVVCIALLPFFLFAQPPREKVEAFKIGFLTKRLNLTPDEAKNFWPVYNKFQDELEKARKQRRETLRTPQQNFDDITHNHAHKTPHTPLLPPPPQPPP